MERGTLAGTPECCAAKGPNRAARGQVRRHRVVRVFVAELVRGTRGGEAVQTQASVQSAPVGRSSISAWRALREPPVRLISWMIGLSAVAHLVMTPLAGLLGLLGWLFTPPAAPELEAEQLRSIPISLLSDEELAQLEAQAQRATPASSAPDSTLPRDPSAPAPAPPTPAPAAPLPPAKAPPEAPKKPAPVAARGSAEGIGHPVAMSGVTSEIVDSNANVNLLMLTERIRNHPLGGRIGKLIVNFPQWSSFFDSGDIDPVRDINRILVVGPQFRRSADVVAILQHDLPQPIVRAAVERLVQRPPKGRWLSAKIPAARAYADRAERLFALTAPHVLVVAPPQLERQILATPPTDFPTPKGDAAVVLHVKTPWRALNGLPFRLPESIAWLRLDVIPNDDGGALARITAEDADARQAAEHAQSLSFALNALTNPDLGALGALVGLRSISFIDKIHFQARGERISGQVRVSPRQLERLLVYAEELAVSWTGRRGDGSAPAAPSVARPRTQDAPQRPARTERGIPGSVPEPIRKAP